MRTCALLLLFAASVDAGEVDYRPVFYVMLQSLESHFTGYVEEVEAEYQRKVARVEERDREALRVLNEAGERLEEQHRRALEALDANRDALNRRVELVNTRIDELEATIGELGATETLASGARALQGEVVDAIDTVRSVLARYRELSRRAEHAFDALEGLAQSYRDGTSPQAQKMARLDEQYRSSVQSEGLLQLERENAYRSARGDLQTWVAEQLERLESLRRRLQEAANAYQDAKHQHDAQQAEVNAAIETYNARAQSFADRGLGPDDENAAAELEALEQDIEAGHTQLMQIRERALSLAANVGPRADAMRAARERLGSARAAREESLARARDELAAHAERMGERLAQRRQTTRAGIESLEAEITGQMEAVQAELIGANRQIEDEFGPDATGLLEAAREWLERATLDPLYRPDGSARFNRSHRAVARLYAAVDRAGAARRAIDELIAEGESKHAALAARYADLRAERAAIEDGKRELEASRSAAARRIGAQASQWEQRREALTSAARERRRALGSFYQARLALTRNEFDAAQSLLLQHLKPGTTATDASAERAPLQQILERESRRLSPLIPSTRLVSFRLFHDFLKLGRPLLAEAGTIEWTRLAQPGSHSGDELEGERKCQFIAAWFQVLNEARLFADLEDGLGSLEPSRTAIDGFLLGLFKAGMMDNAVVVEHPLDSGETGFQIEILGTRYTVDASGSLTRAHR